MRNRTIAAACAVAVLAVACSGGSPHAPATPGGGRIAGLVVSQRSDGSHRAVEPGAHVGIYTRSFPPGGPIMANPPEPIATTESRADGTFAFGGVGPGRYWVTLVGQGHSVAGRWAVVTAQRGASVMLVSCTDCPIPL